MTPKPTKTTGNNKPKKTTTTTSTTESDKELTAFSKHFILPTPPHATKITLTQPVTPNKSPHKQTNKTLHINKTKENQKKPARTKQ